MYTAIKILEKFMYMIWEVIFCKEFVHFMQVIQLIGI